MKVQLSFKANGLRNVAGTFKGTSDPYLIVTQMHSGKGKRPTVLGKTEAIKNSLNPDWTKTFVVEYELGTPINFTASIFDEVRKSDNKPMGNTLFEVGKVLGSDGSVLAKKLKAGGTLYIRVEKCVGTGTLTLKMKGKEFTNQEGWFGKSDPFYELERMDEDPRGRKWNSVYRSEVVRDNLNPVWKQTSVDLSTLCDGDLDRPIQIVVFDHEKSGKHMHMGTAETTVNHLVKASSGGEKRPLRISIKGKKKGKIIVSIAKVVGIEDGLSNQMESASISATPSEPTRPHSSVPTPVSGGVDFVDYVTGGCEVQLNIAIDFTGSNGDPRKPGTLHHFNTDGSYNDYEKVIHSLGSILSNYDADKMYPVWGFGAKYGGVVRHCFMCGSTERVRGVDGVLRAYHEVFRSGLVMSGPTVFTEVIYTAAGMADAAQEESKLKGKQAYSILVILTDGAVSDVEATKNALLEVSGEPLSVIIVGIGNADFSSMRFLDDGLNADRDIAQFVEFNRFQNDSTAFTKEALDEIPKQLTDYFQKAGISPSPAVHRADEDIAIEDFNPDEEIDLSLDFKDDGEIVCQGVTGYTPQNRF